MIEFILIGFVAYFLKAMQPDGFLKFIPRYFKFACFPCYSFWISLITITTLNAFAIYDLNYFISFPIGAIAYAISKYME
jgi:hypothetical protein